MNEFIDIAELLFKAGYEIVSYDKYFNKDTNRYEIDISVSKLVETPTSPSPAF